jgi:hypothetical protein
LFAALLSVAIAVPAHAGRLFDMTIIDRDTGKELPTYLRDGKTYVAGTPGHRYTVRLTNRTAGRVLAVMSVDGVNVLTGETASPDQGGYVWAPWESDAIVGWRKSLDEVAQFVFTALPDSYAARTGRPENVGVIGVAAFVERDRRVERLRKDALPPPPPVPEQAAPLQAPIISSASADRASAGLKQDRAESIAQDTPHLGTGHGSREYAPTEETQFVRATRDPQETLTIWYDSYEHLVAQGIIPKPIAHREPQAFPNRFVPDPPR